MSLPDFKNEAEFREQWIGPFLQKLGYIQVALTHGANEFGKDFIFADFDKFEHIRYYAVQAKLGNIGTASGELDKLLSQVKQCFAVRIKGHKDADEKRVSGVYVFASGKISDQARTQIADTCRAEHYGENVYFLDGDRLERLDQFHSYQDDRRARAAFEGIYFEAVTNVMQIPQIKDALTKGNGFVFRCRYSAMNQALTSPPSNPELFYVLSATYDAVVQLNQSSDTFMVSTLTQTSIGNIDQMIELCDIALTRSTRLRDMARSAIDDLKAKYKVSIEILSDDNDGK